MEIVKRVFSYTLYCSKCGSSDVEVQTWYCQKLHEFYDVHQAAIESGGVCNDCDDVVDLYTWEELYDEWICSEAFVDRSRDKSNVVKTGAKFYWFPEGTPVKDVDAWFNARNPNKISATKMQKSGQILTPYGGVWSIPNEDEQE